MTRTVAALAAALLAAGARAQTAEPTPPAAPPSDAQTPPATTTAAPAAPAAPPAAAAPSAPAAPAAAAPKKEEKKKGTYVIGEKSQISISGRAWAEVHNVGADAGSAPGAVKVDDRWRVHNNSSYLRFRGERELEGGWKLLAQVEAEFGIEGEEGTPFASTRNTGVGVGSPYGTLILGRWDSPTKQTTIGLDPFVGTGIFGYYNVFGQQQASATSSGSNRWDRRLTNGIHYTSPSVAGLTLLAAYSVGETTSNGTIAVDPWTASAALHYRNGPLYVGASYETRNDCGNPDANPGAPSCSSAALGNGTQPNGTDQAVRVGVGFTIKPTFTKLAAAFEHIDLEADATATLAKKTLARDAWFASITQGVFSNRHQLILNYGLATEVSGTGVFADNADTGAQYWTGAYRFWIDKDTDVYAAATQVINQKNASYRFGSGNFGSVPVGSTSTGYGVGMRYMF